MVVAIVSWYSIVGINFKLVTEKFYLKIWSIRKCLDNSRCTRTLQIFEQKGEALGHPGLHQERMLLRYNRERLMPPSFEAESRRPKDLSQGISLAYCFGITNNRFETMCTAIKENKLGSKLPAFSDRTSGVAKKKGDNNKKKDNSICLADELGNKYNITLSNREKGLMQLPNTLSAISTFSWMEKYFDCIGDHMPNCNEIHLDAVTVKEKIYEQYREEFQLNGMEPLSLSRFLEIWTSCFSHVKIRAQKSVTGKCLTCSTLTDMRQTFHSQKILEKNSTQC